MQTDIYYRDITKTENLEDYLMEKVEGAVEDFFKYDSGAHLTVRVETDRHRTQTRKPSYLCEVILKPSRMRTVIKVQKTDENFKRCVARTVNALKVILSKRSSRKAQHGRHDPMLELQTTLPEEWVA
ncbi:HPF/RaiA family ribosome-associated protein [Bdellovibrio sp. 22V]|uniref:HPF/RaiA family ribosome-associated protein n=1 Tax=Bdellovibrio TaxID=958 RepID=UPI0025436908|nr:HPF/RaiA family ribosome-associated protein [Bdellovibrio sp. 22V]WII72582.1 HPF/RaiA family ribosome-associated protein [Bdellovibrio sp. 22V]